MGSWGVSRRQRTYSQRKFSHLRQSGSDKSDEDEASDHECIVNIYIFLSVSSSRSPQWPLD